MSPLWGFVFCGCVSTQVSPLWGWRPDDTKRYENPRNLCNPINPRFRQASVRLGNRTIGVNLVGIRMFFV